MFFIQVLISVALAAMGVAEFDPRAYPLQVTHCPATNRAENTTKNIEIRTQKQSRYTTD